MNFFYFLTKGTFYKHFLVSILILIGILWITTSLLEGYTNHDEVFIVPKLTGQQYQQITETYNNLFRFVIIDSVYRKDSPNGSILQQDPLPGARVKRNRNIYLVIVAQMPERVGMPNLRNLSLRQAMSVLEKNDLILNELEYVNHFARHAVVDQLYKEEIIEPGTELFKGSSINLVLGDGGDNSKTPIPFIIGHKKTEVKQQLHNSFLNLGNEYFLDDYDSIHSRVYKTEPSFDSDTLVAYASRINIWYRSELLFDFKELIQSYQPDSIAIDSLNSLLSN